MRVSKIKDKILRIFLGLRLYFLNQEILKSKRRNSHCDIPFFLENLSHKENFSSVY